MNTKEERAHNLEMHKLSRINTDLTLKNAALNAQCNHLRLAVKHESDKCEAMQINMVQHLDAEFNAERKRLACMRDKLEHERVQLVKWAQNDATVQRQSIMDELGIMKKNLDAHYAGLMKEKLNNLDLLKKQLDDERERIQQNHQEQLVLFLSRIEESIQWRPKMLEAQEQLRRNEQEQIRRTEQELKVRTEAENTALMLSMELEQSKLKVQEAHAQIRRNEQELKVRSEAVKTALMQSNLKLQEAHDQHRWNEQEQIRRNEQELKVRTEAEKTALMRYMELEQSKMKLQESYEQIRRNEQELKVQLEAGKTALMQSKLKLQEAHDQIRRNEQELKVHLEAENIALIQSMELEQSKLKLQEAREQIRRNEQELKVRSEAEKAALMRYNELEQSNLKLQKAHDQSRRNEQELKLRSEAEKTALMRSIEVEHSKLQEAQEQIRRNEQELKGRIEAENIVLMRSIELEQSKLQEAHEQIRRNEQEFNSRLESEKTMLTHSMELRFEAHVRNHTAEIRQTLKISDVAHAIASNYAHTRLIYQLDFKGKRVMIYSHYSEHDEVESYNLLALECIEHYFDYIIILTNCPNKWILHHPDYNKYHLLAYNMKSDFRNYGLFIMQTAKTLMHAAQLCFMNDSFIVVDVNAFGCCIKRLFENGTGSSSHDFVGLTSSHECGYHLQSYFMCFNAPVVPTIISYFETHGLPVNHHAAISQYELGITTHLTTLGFSSYAIVSNNDMRFPRNTTCFKWAAVLQDIGIIKRQHFFKKYPFRTAMTDADIAQAAEKYSYNKHFIHFLKYHNMYKM